MSGACVRAPDTERSNMTIFHSNGDRLLDPTRGSRSPIAPSSRQMPARRFARRVWRRLGAAFNIIHQAIIAAKTRRLARALMMHAGSRYEVFLRPDANESHDQNKDAAKVPQRPLIIGDNWDF